MTDAPRPRRPTRTTLLFLLLLVVGVFAAWQVHLALVDRRPDAPQPDPREIARRNLPQMQPDPEASIDAFSDPASLVGLKKLASDPSPASPPDGAELRWAYRRSNGEVSVRYAWAGEVAGALAHYRRELDRRGYELHADDRRMMDARWLIAGNDRRRVHVALREDARKPRIVHIVVTVLGLDEGPPD